MFSEVLASRASHVLRHLRHLTLSEMGVTEEYLIRRGTS